MSNELARARPLSYGAIDAGGGRKIGIAPSLEFNSFGIGADAFLDW
jgi:hypothetical protein